MKKLNKLQINHEKLMNNEELITLRGGYDGCSCLCYNWDFQVVGAIGGEVNALTCNPECLAAFGHGFGHCS
jgi:natural product precursor